MTVDGLPWTLIALLSASGLGMALLSCLRGMRPRLEIPLWWSLYAIWIAVVLAGDIARVFTTLLLASGLAGLVHGVTSALLLDRYIANNPWHADAMTGPRHVLMIQFIAMGVVIGLAFGAVVGGIGWGLVRLL